MLKLLKYPSPVLNQISNDCVESDLQLIKDVYLQMIEVMNQPKGVGLAAVQVGILKRFCLLQNPSDLKNPYIIINPVVIESLDLTKKQEGCLSLPLFYEPVDRYQQITVAYMDETWTSRTAVFVDIEAQCLQHEIDHFNGRLLLDDLSPMIKQMYNKKLIKKGIL